MKKSPVPLLIAGESAAELGMALGAALIFEGHPATIAAGIALLTASLAARGKLKRKP